MRSSLWAVVSLLAVDAVACGCPGGNFVVPERSVTGDLSWQSADGAESLDGHFSSSPSGDGISYAHATVPVSGVAGPALPTDLVLFAMAPGCHAGATGARLCDRQLRMRLTVHDVAPGAASYALDDGHAE